MSWATKNIANMARSAFRAAVNAALQALETKNSGATEPTETYAYQEWADTTSGWLKQRNAANDAWINVRALADATTAAGEALRVAADAAAQRTALAVLSSAQNQTQAATRFTVGGTADAMTGALSPAITGYTAGLRVTTTPGGANTVTGPTLNLNSLGNKTIKKRDSGGTKVALVAGDYNASGPFDFEYDGTDFILLNPIVSASSIQHGQCRLAKSGANLVLSPFNGNKLIINGTVQAIPAAGVSLAAPATSGTLYYIYAYMNGATMTLEASTTGHATDSTTGVEIKSGDATRTLVGMARTVSSAWVDTNAQRFVESWFNRQVRYAINTFTADRSTTSASFVELNSEIRAEWVSFNTQVRVDNSAIVRLNSGSAQVMNAGIGIDDAVVEVGYMTVKANTAGATEHQNMSNFTTPTVAEGYHYATMVAAISAGGTLTAYSPCAICVTLS